MTDEVTERRENYRTFWIYLVSSLLLVFKTRHFGDSVFLRLQMEPTQVGPIDRARASEAVNQSPHARTV